MDRRQALISLFGGSLLMPAVAAELHERARRHATSTPDAAAPGSGLTHN